MSEATFDSKNIFEKQAKTATRRSTDSGSRTDFDSRVYFSLSSKVECEEEQKTDRY